MESSFLWLGEGFEGIKLRSQKPKYVRYSTICPAIHKNKIKRRWNKLVILLQAVSSLQKKRRGIRVDTDNSAVTEYADIWDPYRSLPISQFKTFFVFFFCCMACFITVRNNFWQVKHKHVLFLLTIISTLSRCSVQMLED